MRKWLIAFLIAANLAAQVFGATQEVRQDTYTHKIIKPPSSLGAAFDLDFSDVTVNIGGGGGGGAGGANQQMQYNNALTFGGVPYLLFNGTTVLQRAGARYQLTDPTDITKTARIDLSQIPTATLRTVLVAPSADSVTIVPLTAASTHFITGVSSTGTLTEAQPNFTDLSGKLALSQTTMNTGKLIGRSTASTGAMEEITVGTNLTLAGGVLDATGTGGTPSGSNQQLQFNDSGNFGGVPGIISDGVTAFIKGGAFTRLQDNSDPTKLLSLGLSNIPTGTLRTLTVAGADSVTVAPDAGASNNFLTAISAIGVISKAQPSFSNLSGTATLAQITVPIAKERFVDPVNGVDGTGSANLARPYLTIAGACAASSSGDVIYLYPNTSGYDQSTTPLVIPAGVTIVGAGPDTTLIKGAVTGVTRAVVEPSTSSAIYNVSIQNTSSTGIPFGVGSSSAAFTSAFIGGSKVIGVANGIYINKAGTTGLVVENVTISSQTDCLFQGTSTSTTQVRGSDFVSDGTATTASRGVYVTAGTVLFNYGNITVGNSTGSNYGALGDGSGAVIELHGVRIANAGGGTDADVKQANSATVGVDDVYRPNAAALTTSGTITQLSRYAVRDNNLTDYPNIGSGTRGDILFRNATGWVKLNAGIDGNVLTTHGNTADPEWLTAGSGGIISDTAFSSAWDAQTTTGPSQNAAYDYFHLIAPGDNGKVNLINQSAGITNTNAGGTVQTPLAAPSGTIVGDTDVQKLTNKRVRNRNLSLPSPGATPAISTDDYDTVHITAASADITSMTTSLTGTPDPADALVIDITDDGTPRAITWGSKFEASPGQSLPIITTASTRMDIGFKWNQADSKWRCLASSNAGASGSGTVTSVGLTGANGITVTGATPITSSGSWALSLPVTIAGTAGKTFTLSNNITLAGTDGSTINVGAGGTLGSNAFTSTAYLDATNISDSVFASGWNGVTTIAPSKNSVYDWGHTFDTDDNGKVNVLDLTTAELVKTNSSGVVSSATGGTDYANLAWKTFSVSGQSDVVADTASDTLTLAAGAGITITTTPGTDTITVASSGGSIAWGAITGTLSAQTDLQTALDAKTNVAIVPNTAPSAGQILAGNAGGTAYAPVTLSGGTGVTASLASTGVLSLSNLANSRLTNSAITIAGTSTSLGGTITLDTITGVSSNGYIKRTGANTLTNSATIPFSDLSSTPTTLSGYGITDAQPLDSDLTTIAGLTATTDNFMVSVSSAWASRTPSQVRTTLGLVIGTNVQAWDADLDTWATKTAPSGTVIGTTDTQTLTNKRINPRIDDQNIPTSPYAINSDSFDEATLRAIGAALTINAPTGTPVEGQHLILRFKDDGTARALTFQTGSSGQFRFSSDLAAPSTTVLSKTLYMGFIYNSTDSRWDNVAQLNNF